MSLNEIKPPQQPNIINSQIPIVTAAVSRLTAADKIVDVGDDDTDIVVVSIDVINVVDVSIGSR
jgi:hypothetical protein